MIGTANSGKERKKMAEKVKITHKKTDIRDAKQLEIITANAEKLNALIEYIAACDYPEVFEESEVEENE